MSTGLLTRGFPTAPHFIELTGPKMKPKPPPPSPDQPFGYRFRVIPPCQDVVEYLSYDAELQLTRINGEIHASGGGRTTHRFTTTIKTWLDTIYSLEWIQDTVVGPGY
jgi:hypothetical protein